MKKTIKKYIPILIGKRLLFTFFFNKQKALHKAYRLFSSPQKGEILIDQEHFLEEAEDDVLLIGDNYIQTYRWPNYGETILLVHGWESNSHRWKALIKKLKREHYNIIAFDAPAQGNSTGKILNVPLYAECLEKIVSLYRPNHIIGHSVGGMTTMFYQHKYSNPEINKLIILAPPTELEVIMKGYQKTLGLTDKFMDALNNFFKTKFGYHFEEFSTALFAKTINNQGLLIHDELDTIAPYSGSLKTSKNWKNVTFITTSDFGHSLFYDEADQFIIDFLKK